jgi:hypothetical protein
VPPSSTHHYLSPSPSPSSHSFPSPPAAAWRRKEIQKKK